MAPRSSMPGNTRIIASDGFGIFSPGKGSIQLTPKGSSPSAKSASTVGKQVTTVTPHLSYPPADYPNPVTQP